MSGLLFMINCDENSKTMFCFGKLYFSETLKYSREKRINEVE